MILIYQNFETKENLFSVKIETSLPDYNGVTGETFWYTT